MNEARLMNGLITGWFILALFVFVALLLFDAPYGRLMRKGFGPTLPNSLGWLLMEAPASLGFFLFFYLGYDRANITAWVFLILWQSHYIFRAFIYPFWLRGKGKSIPLSVVGMGIGFNVVNSYLNARYLFTFSGGYPPSWLSSIPFLTGLGIFYGGMLINRQSDSILRNLRRPGESGYRIPYGGLFEFVSCPNYLGEIIQWFGWALATWSLPGLAFAVWTCANLAPRAWSYHRWYLERFPDYPAERAPLIPRPGLIFSKLREGYLSK